MNKRFGIFIPCYNAAKTIADTLKAVHQAIVATGRAIPVFVYDDCSKDNSLEVAAAAGKEIERFSVVRNEQNSGERKTTNKAFTDFKDKYDWIFIIHADDLPKKDWLTTLIGYIEQLPTDDYFTVWSSYDSFNDNDTGNTINGDNSGQVEQIIRGEEQIRYFLSKATSNWHISGAALNVSIYHRLNGFDESMAQYGDTDYFVRALLAGFRDLYICRTLSLYRVSRGSVSGVSARINRDVSEIYYIIKKHRNFLRPMDVRKLYQAVNRLSARRTIKWLLKGNIGLAWLNFKQFAKSATLLAKLW